MKIISKTKLCLLLAFSFLFSIFSFAQTIRDSSTYCKDCLLKYPMMQPLNAFEFPLVPFYISKDSETFVYYYYYDETSFTRYTLHYSFNKNNLSGKFYGIGADTSEYFSGSFIVDTNAIHNTIIPHSNNYTHSANYPNIDFPIAVCCYYSFLPDSFCLYRRSGGVVHYRNEINFKRGRLDGHYQFFCDTSKFSDGYYSNGKKIGYWRENYEYGNFVRRKYSEQGNILYEAYYLGKSDNLARENFNLIDSFPMVVYTDSGEFIREETSHKSIVYYPNGNKKIQYTTYSPDTFTDSLIYWYENGTIQQTCFKQEKLYEIKMYYENGKLKSWGYSKSPHGNTESENKDWIGIYQRWDENGNLIETRAFDKHGKLIEKN